MEDLRIESGLPDSKCESRLGQYSCTRWAKLELDALGSACNRCRWHFLLLPGSGAGNITRRKRYSEIECGVEFRGFRPCVSGKTGVAAHEVYIHLWDRP